jgi:hypothetical protein
MSQDWSGDREEGEGEEDVLPPPRRPAQQRPVQQRPVQQRSAPQRPVAAQRPAPRTSQSTRVAPARSGRRGGSPPRDTFPIAVSAVVIVLLLGLLAVFLLNNGGTPATTGTSAGAPAATVAGGGAPAAAGAATADPAQVPRMPLDEFKKLYDDPAKRPLIVDVRAADAYDQGHIAGAVNIPESDVDARIAEFPKDKLIIAYCQ